MPQLNTNVHVEDASGTMKVFGPGDDVPSWAVERITNPHVWVDEPPEPEGPEDDPSTPAAAPAAKRGRKPALVKDAA